MTKSSLPPEIDSRFRSGLLLTAGIFVVTFFLIGMTVAAVLHSAPPKVFESDATVLIERRARPAQPLPNKFSLRHDQLIGEDNILTKALIKYDLDELKTLRDLPSNDQINYIQSNLRVQRSEEDANVYRLRYRSSDARDAQTILATLVNVYEKHLIPKYNNYDRSDTRELLLKMKKRFAKELAAQIEKVEQVEKRIAAGQTRKDDPATLKELQEDVEKLQEKLSIASSQYTQQVSLQKKKVPQRTLSPASKGVSIDPPLYSVVWRRLWGVASLVAVLIRRNRS